MTMGSKRSAGWLTCLEEIYEGIKDVLFLGQPVTLKSLDVQGDRIVVAVIQQQGKTAKVSMDSIELIKPTKLQAL